MRETLRLRQAALSATLSLAVLFPVSAAAQAPTGPRLTPTTAAGAPLAGLEIGDALHTTLSGAAPLSPYTFELRDERGDVVAKAEVRTDRLGDTSPTLLWPRSGVVGCNPDAEPDPDAYRFADFDQAEAVLAGRVFTLTAVDTVGRNLTSTALPLALRTTPLFFLADGSGCPRWDFTDGTTPFVAGKDVQFAASARIWAVAEKLVPWEIGDLIEDLRPSYPEGQVMHFGPDPENSQVEVDLVEDQPTGFFCIVVRLSPSPEPPSSPYFQLGDIAPQLKDCANWGEGVVIREPWG